MRHIKNDLPVNNNNDDDCNGRNYGCHGTWGGIACFDRCVLMAIVNCSLSFKAAYSALCWFFFNAHLVIIWQSLTVVLSYFNISLILKHLLRWVTLRFYLFVHSREMSSWCLPSLAAPQNSFLHPQANKINEYYFTVPSLY